MNSKVSNLVSLSNNKFNINLLETIEHKELFHNLNKNLNQNKKINLYENINNKKFDINDNTENEEYYIINDDNSNDKENILKNQDNEINYLKYNSFNFKNEHSKKKIISSKSQKDVLKKKSENYQEIFTKLSPGKNIRCITQDNESQNYEINNKKNKKLKKGNAQIGKKDINLNNFNFERKNIHNLQIKQNDNNYFNDFLNNNNNNENICYFKGGKKKESNLCKNTSNSYNNKNGNNNLDVYNRLYNKSYYNKKKNNINCNEDNNCTFNPQLLSDIKIKKKS